MNSLLQCLFNDFEFRQAIYNTSNQTSPIIKEIKSLFAALQLSEKSAISTSELIEAFGWAKSQVFEQHDVHELFSVLIEALGQTSPELNGTLQNMFQGCYNGVFNQYFQFHFLYLSQLIFLPSGSTWQSLRQMC